MSTWGVLLTIIKKANHFVIHLTVIMVLGTVGFILLTPATANGQPVPRIDPTGRSGDKRLPPSEELLPAPQPEVVLPPIIAPPTDEFVGPPSLEVYINQINILGSTVFTEEELAVVSAPYLNRKLSSNDLEALRRALTALYIRSGYVTSGAVIPDQTVEKGSLTIQIIEGSLQEIEISGNRWFRDRYIENRIGLDAGPPVRVAPLQQRLQLLQQDQRIDHINAELKPGAGLGQSELVVNIEERPPFNLWIGVDNYAPPSIGAERFQVTAAHQNLTGNGDILDVTLGRSEGINPKIEAGYSLPVSKYDTRLTLRYRRNDFEVIESTFKDLDVESESEIYEITLTQPVFRSLRDQIDLALTGEYLHTESFLLGAPFSFSPGAEDGETTVAALRFIQAWTRRTQREVIAAISRFSFGLDVLDATINESGIPDGEFFAWLGGIPVGQIVW